MSEIPEAIEAVQMRMVEEVAAWTIKTAEMLAAEATLKALSAQRAAEREVLVTEHTVKIQEKLSQQVANCMRPTTMLRPAIMRVEDAWKATYGDVVGAGPTPELACQDFDRKWLGKDEL